MNFTNILPNLYVGSCPQDADDVICLAKLGVTAVLNVQTDEDIEYTEIAWSRVCREYVRSAIQLRRVRITDFDTADLKEKLRLSVKTLDALLRSGNRVYVHCTAGANRAPTIAAAYLHWCQDWELGHAISCIEEKRSCYIDRKAIVSRST